MQTPLIRPRKAAPGDKVAVLSPSFAAPAVAPAVHEQAMRRLEELTGLVPVEYPTTRQLGATDRERAADLNAAFADPEIRAVLATIGGEDQITVVPHLDPHFVRADPKPFLGYSDNTNLLSWLWTNGVAGFYGGSTQVQLGPGPAVDEEHARALRAALLTGDRIQITEPGESEDIGKDWNDPAALSEFGDREPTEPWTWAGPTRSVTGPTWGGCAEVVQWLLAAGRFPADPAVLEGGVLLLDVRGAHPGSRVRVDRPGPGRARAVVGCGRRPGGPTSDVEFRGPAQPRRTRRPPRRAAGRGDQDRAAVQL